MQRDVGGPGFLPGGDGEALPFCALRVGPVAHQGFDYGLMKRVEVFRKIRRRVRNRLGERLGPVFESLRRNIAALTRIQSGTRQWTGE